MKTTFLFLILTLCFFSVGAVRLVHASDVAVKNTGFITSNIWYSKESFYSDETVRIYTVIFNGSSYDLSGSVEFLDNDALLGRTDFSLLPTGQVRDVSVPWKTAEGKHAISARIVDASISVHGGPKTAITLENAQAGKSEISVEVDPKIVATQAQAEAAKATATGAQVARTVSNAVQTVRNVIPTPVKEGTSAGVGAIDNLRASLGAQLEIAKQNKGKEIDLLNTSKTPAAVQAQKTKQNTGIVSTVSSGMEKPFAYVTYGILAALQYFFEWRILFYGVLLYALYRLIKWGIQKIRDR